jgi:hypothetical protein
MPVEDLSAWVEQDPGTHLAVTAGTAHYVGPVGVPDEAWLSKAVTVPTSFMHKIALEAVTIYGTTGNKGVWGADAAAPASPDVVPELGLVIVPGVSVGKYSLRLFCTSLAHTSDAPVVLTEGDPLDVTITRAGTLLTADFAGVTPGHPYMSVVCGAAALDYLWCSYVASGDGVGAEWRMGPFTILGGYIHTGCNYTARYWTP